MIQIIPFIIVALMAPVFAQELPGGGGMDVKPFKNSTLNNIQVEVSPGMEKGEKKIAMTFSFDKRPSNFFHYLMKKPTRIVMDYYDTQEPDDPIFVVTEPPFLSCQVEDLKIDINKDIAGLEADIRELTRITLLVNVDLIYNVRTEGESVVLFYHWTDNKEKQAQYIVSKKSNWLLWGSVGTGAVGGAVAAYLVTRPEKIIEDAILPDTGPVRPTP